MIYRRNVIGECQLSVVLVPKFVRTMFEKSQSLIEVCSVRVAIQCERCEKDVKS